jgi:hypothetical protein
LGPKRKTHSRLVSGFRENLLNKTISAAKSLARCAEHETRTTHSVLVHRHLAKSSHWKTQYYRANWIPVKYSGFFLTINKIQLARDVTEIKTQTASPSLSPSGTHVCKGSHELRDELLRHFGIPLLKLQCRSCNLKVLLDWKSG